MAQLIVQNLEDDIHQKLYSLGRPVEVRDVQIAGIVFVRHAILATRNFKHFKDTGISLINPWGDVP